MIEIDYTDPASEAEWDQWYHHYIRDLVTVPGIFTGQRFLAISPTPFRHLAAYSLQTLEAYASPRYREIGGGGNASAKWRSHIRRRRNLFDGGSLPEVVPDRDVLLVADEHLPATEGVAFQRLDVIDMPALAAQPGSPLAAQVPFEGKPALRYLAVMSRTRADELGLLQRDGIVAYAAHGAQATKSDG